MLKIYKSKSQVSVTVRLKSGSNTHITFQPQTGGGSIYYTKDDIVQDGLESHPKFGRLFKLVGAQEEKKVDGGYAVIAGKVEANDEGNGPEEAEGAKQSASGATFTASCNDDAKEYLAEKYGVKRSLMRTKDQILAAAQQHGVEIIWK